MDADERRVMVFGTVATTILVAWRPQMASMGGRQQSWRVSSCGGEMHDGLDTPAVRLGVAFGSRRQPARELDMTVRCRESGWRLTVAEVVGVGTRCKQQLDAALTSRFRCGRKGRPATGAVDIDRSASLEYELNADRVSVLCEAIYWTPSSAWLLGHRVGSWPQQRSQPGG